MIIDVWQYADAQEKVATPRLKEALAFSTALSRARYIFDIQLKTEDQEFLEQLRPIAEYPDDPKGKPHRVQGRYAYNLASSDPEGRSEEIALYGARAGLKRFWHIVVSSREGEDLTPEKLEQVRQVFLRVLEVKNCPSIWAVHGDTDNQHMHGLVVSYLPAEDRSVKFGQDWWKEACQIATAIIERDLGLDAEPNHRLVADHTGVYDRISDTRVADENGKIIGRPEILAMQKAQRLWKQGNYAPVEELAKTEHALEEAIRSMAEPRILKATSAKDMHERLARVGLRYVASDTGARVVANGYKVGPGKDRLGQGIAASKVYANAALKKLSRRFERSGGYHAADPDLRVRRFVMPRYNALDEGARKRYSETRLEQEECTALIEHLQDHNARRYRWTRDNEVGADVNECRAQYKRDHVAELERAKAMKVALAKSANAKLKGPVPNPQEESLALLWGPPPKHGTPRHLQAREEKKAEIEKRYEIERDAAKRYYLDGQLAFIVRLRTIEIFSRKRRVQIDALKLAKLLFEKVRIAARHALRTRFARIAAELNAPVGEPVMAKVAAAHGDRVVSKAIPGIVASADAYEATFADRQRLRRKSHALKRARRDKDTDPNSEPTLDIKALATQYEDAKHACDKAMQPQPLEAALQKLTSDIDHDTLMLSSSRYAQKHDDYTFRYIDDPVLLREFEDDRSVLVDWQMQLSLEAIDAIQRDKRRWIAAAIATGNASIEKGRFKMVGEQVPWAQDFWNAQRRDPKLRRLIGVARARPELFPFDRDERPGNRAIEAAEGSNSYLALSIRTMRHAQEGRLYGPDGRLSDPKAKQPLNVQPPSRGKSRNGYAAGQDADIATTVQKPRGGPGRFPHRDQGREPER